MIRRPTGRPTGRPTSRLQRLAAVALLLAATGAAQAHEAGGLAIPEQPGLGLDAALAVGAFDAGTATAWPAPRLSGWMGQGADDRRGARLEQASVGAGLRLSEALGARLAAGAHPGGRTHVETALLAWRIGATPADTASGTLAATPAADPDAAEPAAWSAQLGRRSVPLGTVVDAAGAFDAFSEAPLAKRLLLNDDWIDEGLLLGWQREADGPAAALTGAELGVWRARVYPGGLAGPPALTLKLSGLAGALGWDLALAHLRPRDRGAPVVSTRIGHSHSLPDCRASLDGLVCYGGTSTLLSAGARWQPASARWQLQGALLGLQERGRLASDSGDIAYRGRHWGGWLEGDWPWAAAWSTQLRLERVQARHALDGTNAHLIADEAGLRPNRPATRVAATLAWDGPAGLRASLEGGQEKSAAAEPLRWIGLRLVWRQAFGPWTW